MDMLTKIREKRSALGGIRENSVIAKGDAVYAVNIVYINGKNLPTSVAAVELHSYDWPMEKTGKPEIISLLDIDKVIEY